MDNIVTKEGANLVEVYRANNTYLNVSAEIEEMQSALTTDLETHIWKVNGTIKKALKDASGSSNTPASRVFFSDSEGAASSDSVFIYDSANKKLGIGVSPAIGAKLHLHQASTANTLIKLSNTTTGSGEHDGLNIGVVGDSYVVRTQYARPIIIEAENPSEQGQYLEIAKFQRTGSVSNTILNSDLKVNTIVAKSTAASVFLTHEENTIKTRTAAQVRGDIGAAALIHTHPWADITDKPSAFPPASHTHAIADITSLQTTLDGKQPLDSDLTAIAGLTHSNRNVLISDGSTWTRRALVAEDIPNLSATKITSGTLDNARLSFNPDYFVQGTNNRRMILVNSTNPLVSNEFCTFFRMDNTDPSFDSRLTGGVGLGFKVINNSGTYSFELMGQPSGNGVLLFGGVDHAGNRYPWKSIWHSGNFDPSTKANATHGHPWGDITGKPSTFAPAAHGLVSSTHTVSGLTAGHVLKALSATTYGFGAIAWSEIASKPSTFAPSAHTHPWSEITDKPSTFTPSAHSHAWSEITGKPSSIAYKNEFNVFTAPSGISIDDVTAEADGTSTTNWNVVSHIQLVSNNNKMAFFLGSPQNERKAFIQVGHASSAYAPYLGELRLNPFGGNVTVNGYGVWHSGNFNPSTKANATHGHSWGEITGKPTGTTNYITMFTNGATGTIGNSQLVQSTDEVTASKGFTSTDYLQSMGPLYARSHIYLINKAGDAWLNFVTRDVSGSEAVADLSNVGKISMISPSTNNTMELYVDNSRSAAGINAETGLLEIRNTSTAATGDILIQSVTSDINISSQGESGEISLDAKRVKISRRNLKSQTFTYTVNGSYIIDLNNYYDVNLFIINNTATWVSIGFKNATVGDEIHVNIKGYGAVVYQRDPNSENAWYEWPNDAIKLDEFFYKLICTGTDNYYGQTINTWIIGS